MKWEKKKNKTNEIMWQLLVGSRSSVSSAETREGTHHFQIRTRPVTHPSEPPTMGYSTANDLTGWKPSQKNPAPPVNTHMF